VWTEIERSDHVEGEIRTLDKSGKEITFVRFQCFGFDCEVAAQRDYDTRISTLHTMCVADTYLDEMSGTTTASSTGAALVAAFESCMLTMRTERGVGLRPPEKGTDDLPRWRR
jgi:hypothetical protein